MKNFLILAFTLLITAAIGAAVIAQNSNTQSNNTNASANKNSKVTNANKSTNTNKSLNANKGANTNHNANTNSSTGSQSNRNANSSSVTRQKIIDINSASKQELMTLPGIGEAYSQKIIEGRPYKMKSDLVKRGIITQALYNSISAKIVAHQKNTP